MVEFLINNVVSSIISGALGLVAVLLFFKLFRVRDPRLRFFLLFAPLVKALLVLMDTPLITNINIPGRVLLMFRIPDPLGLISSPLLPDMGTLVYNKSLGSIVLIASLAAVGTALLARWVQLFLLRYKLANGPEMVEEEAPELVKRLHYLVDRIGVKTPRFVLTEESHPVPFTIGVFRPAIVLSNELLSEFSERSLDAILAHELAHVKRLDSLTRWLATILRDVQFFNPAVHLAYRRLELEREVACDLIAAEATNVSPQFLADVVLNVVLFYRRKLAGAIEAGAAIASLGSGVVSRFLASGPAIARLIALEFQPLIKRMEVLKERGMGLSDLTYLSWVAAILYFLAVVWIQVGIYARVWGLNLFVR
ncbi:MAG: M56 family metallopeptidase [Actinobacteria bacterium]|nr:M56 family metallopeptidase [Actinomycetota bacterium]